MEVPSGQISNLPLFTTFYQFDILNKKVNGGRTRMFWIFYFVIFSGIMYTALRIGKKSREGRKYNFTKDESACYFKNNDLVLNGFPPQFAPVDGIDYVEFTYDPKFVEKAYKYDFWCKIVNKDGTTSKTVYYKSFAYGNNVLRPRDMVKIIQAGGLRCVLPPLAGGKDADVPDTEEM